MSKTRKPAAKKATKAKKAGRPKKTAVKKTTTRKAPAKKTKATRKAKPVVKKAKATRGRPAAKKTARKTTAKSTAKSSKTAAFTSKAITTKQTKAQVFNEMTDITGMEKKDVKLLMSALKNIVERHLKPKGSGEVTIPELGIKIRRVTKKATKARMGRNPFTGEAIKIAAKPARKTVKVSALKTLKELA